MMDITECPVCYHEFDRPLQLSCGHTVCAGCADKLKINSEQQVVVDRGLAAEPHAGMHRLYHQILPDINEQRGYSTQQGWHRQGYNDWHPNFGMGMGTGMGMGPMVMGPMGMVGPMGMRPAPQPGPMGMQPAPQPGPMGMQPAPQRMTLQTRFPLAEHESGYPHRAARATRRSVTEIRCPECRSMTEVPATGLPVNYRLKELIERMKKEKDAATSLSQSASAMICSECDKEVEKGVYFVCGACPEKARICPLCVVRLHLSHNERIVERKALTEQDLI